MDAHNVAVADGGKTAGASSAFGATTASNSGNTSTNGPKGARNKRKQPDDAGEHFPASKRRACDSQPQPSVADYFDVTHQPHHHHPNNAAYNAAFGGSGSYAPMAGASTSAQLNNNYTHLQPPAPADKPTSTGGRPSRAKPKSPATKAREKARAKDRALERERERDQYRIGDATDEDTLEARSPVSPPPDVQQHRRLHAVDSPAPGAESTGCITTSTFGVQATKPADLRLCPLPALAWAEAGDVWRLMCRKDEKALLERDPAMLERHPGIQTRMRAILLDWLMEVCEVYKLHRETYYLAVDYLDRYLTANARLAKTRLQLIGITCLFTAAKVEEIYPPKIAEFAYVTDGACTEDDIVKQEMLLMLGLNWSINPVTIMGWLSVYMQLNCSNRTPAGLSKVGAEAQARRAQNAGVAFVYPQFSALEFVLAARVLDLCTLDVEMAHFQYSVVAAAVLVLTINRTTALRVSGLDWNTVKPCVKWMEPYYEVVMADSAQLFLAEQDEQVQQSYGLRHICADITTDDSHIIQTHTTSITLFEEALRNREARIALAIRTNKKIAAAEAKKKQQSTPAGQTTLLANNGGVSSPCPLTPPDSNRKFNDSLGAAAAGAASSNVATGDVGDLLLDTGELLPPVSSVY